MDQINLHKKIKEILGKNPQDVEKDEVLGLISKNFDAKNYFFAKANERWLDWLWENDFLDVIKEKAEDPTRYSYRTPELRYLVRMAEKKPVKVAEIINSEETATTEENFNPEVIDQFLRICSELPARELKKIIPKIKKENWVKLMSPFNQWGFEYEKMFKTLFDVKDYETILNLADIVLAIKTKDEIKKEKNQFTENPFYFSDFSNIKVFDYLVRIDDKKYIRKAFKLVVRTMAQIIKIKEKDQKNKSNVFAIDDHLLLIDKDFFELDLKERIVFPRDNVSNLAAVMKILAERFITKYCQSNPEKVKKFFNRYIGTFDNPKAPLPDSKAMWRFRLFVLSLCPQVFKEELKNTFSRLFEVMESKKSYYEIESGAEYKKALKKGFGVLDSKYQREYVSNVFKYFGRSFEDRQEEQQYKRDGWQILSSICNYLTKKERQKCEKIFGRKCNPNFEPKPLIGEIKTGFVSPRGQISQEEFHNKPIDEIVKLLKTEWTPENLRKKDKKNDFFRPLNAEGIGEQLKKDIPTRFQEYINKAPLFFERKKLDSHYTYSFLSGIREHIRNNREKVTNINWEGLINLFLKIKKSGEDESFENGERDRKTFDVWLAGWTAVHSAMADIIQGLLNEQNGKSIIDFPKYRENIFGIISYLLRFPDPGPKDEQVETAKSKTKSSEDSDYMVSDPFTIAINTVRGQAFQSFVLFVYQGGKELEKKKIKIKNNVKEVYKEVLEKENTRALMFMFGHYLPSFYFRDKNWIKKLLPKIFPKEKRDLFLASTEGYLVQSLYKEMFFDKNFQNLYKEWIDLKDTNYSNNQKHFKDIDEALADHLALALVHFSKFDFKHPLFVKFWEKENVKRQKEFISFIGRHCLSRDSAKKWIEDNKINIDKVKKLWDWILKKKINPKILAGFGFWINPNEEVINDDFTIEKIAETLKKSDGDIVWDYGLLKRLPIFAEKNGEKTLEIISSYLLDSENKNNLNQNRRSPLLYKDEVKEAMQIIYDNGNKKTKQEVTNLINILIEKGNSMFWDLEEIIEDK